MKRIAILALAVLPLFASADVVVPDKDRLEPADTTTATTTATTTTATTTTATTTATQAPVQTAPPTPAPQKRKSNPFAVWIPVGVVLMVILIARRKRLQSGG